MTIKLFSILTAVILLYSCENNPDAKPKSDQKKFQNENHIHTEKNKIELDKGKKWKVKDEMLIHIRNMEKEVHSFASSKTKDYKSLAKNLQASIGLLTSNCTMTGKAHDELHKWLLPYIELIGNLSTSKNEEFQKKQFENIQTSFVVFNQFFN